MTTIETDTLIVGGGLSGLWAAVLLHGQETPFLVLEGRPEPGGRIQTAARAVGECRARSE